MTATGNAAPLLRAIAVTADRHRAQRQKDRAKTLYINYLRSPGWRSCRTV